MGQARQIVKRLGNSGIAFLILLVLYFVFYFTDHTGLFLIDFCVMIPLGLFVSIRFFLRVQNRVLEPSQPPALRLWPVRVLAGNPAVLHVPANGLDTDQ